MSMKLDPKTADKVRREHDRIKPQYRPPFARYAVAAVAAIGLVAFLVV
jgi:hypothetical protein